MSEQADALRRRISTFAADVLRFVRGLPAAAAADTVIKHVARATGAIAANYRAACRARSHRDYVTGLTAAVQEAGEAGHWLWMAGQLGIADVNDVSRLAADSQAIRAALSTLLNNARRHATSEAGQRFT